MGRDTDPIHKRLAEFIEAEIPGCAFVGISNEKEVFLSFDDENPEKMSAAKNKTKKHFGNEIENLTTIVSVSIEEVTRMVDGLNKALEEMEEPKPTLLDIGSF